MKYSRWNPRPPEFDERLCADYQRYARDHRLAELCDELRAIDPDLTLPRMRARARALDLQVSANRGAHPSQRKYVDWSDDQVRAEFEAFKVSGVSVSRWCKRHRYNRGRWSSRVRDVVGEDAWDVAVEHNWPDYTWYVAGRTLEYAVVAALQRCGFFPQRTKRSLTAADVSGMRADLNVLVQCKVHGYVPPKEWNALIELADRAGATALVATHDLTKARIQWYRITGPKDGTRRSQPWEPVKVTTDGLVPVGA